MGLLTPNGFKAGLSYDNLGGQDQVMVRQRVKEGDPTSRRERSIIEFLRRERLRGAASRWARIHAQAEEAMRFYDCEVNVMIDQATNKVVEWRPQNLQDLMRNPTRSCNFLAVFTDAQVARILGGRPMPRAIAGLGGMGTGRNRLVARVTDGLMRHIDTVNAGEMMNQRQILYGVLAGAGYKILWHDPTTPGRKAVLDQRGAVRYVDGVVGEIFYDVVSPLNVLYEYGCDFRNIQWFLYVEAATLGRVKSLYENGKFVWPTSQSARDNWPGAKSMEGVLAPRDPERDRDQTEVLIFHYFEKEEEPNGKCAWWKFTFCEDTTLAAPADTGRYELPVSGYFYNKSAFSNVPLAVATQAVNLQREINQSLQGLAYRRRLYQFAKPVFPAGTLQRGVVWDNSPDPFQAPVDASGKLIVPQYIQHPPIDAPGFAQYMAQLIAFMGDLFNIHETSRGIVSSGITSGKQAIVATQQDAGNLQRPVSAFLASERDFWKKVISLAKEKYTDGRVLEIVGKDQALEVEHFRRAYLNEVSTIDVKVTSRIPMEPEQRRQFVLTLAEAGMFAPENELSLKRILDYMEFDNFVEGEVDEVLQAKAKALKEIEMLDRRPQDVPAPGLYELHEIELPTHEQRTRWPDWAKLDRATQDAHIAHIKATRQALLMRRTEDAEDAAEVQGKAEAVRMKIVTQAAPPPPQPLQ